MVKRIYHISFPFFISEFNLEVQHNIVTGVACEAGESIKPGVERSGTPGSRANIFQPAERAKVERRNYPRQPKKPRKTIDLSRTV